MILSLFRFHGGTIRTHKRHSAVLLTAVQRNSTNVYHYSKEKVEREKVNNEVKVHSYAMFISFTFSALTKDETLMWSNSQKSGSAKPPLFVFDDRLLRIKPDGALSAVIRLTKIQFAESRELFKDSSLIGFSVPWY
ncbi:hypothetical protein Baya_9808 [Bagarius yarrelli]|uniref:Uncharacterized protein n=1 Tax=Bagarius yarrelli TaxID=175774 RepID=A0A556U939_BAGYA|nr:hypothetical protein Baya_9808 [Bagarius yarrelli]